MNKKLMKAKLEEVKIFVEMIELDLANKEISEESWNTDVNALSEITQEIMDEYYDVQLDSVKEYEDMGLITYPGTDISPWDDCLDLQIIGVSYEYKNLEKEFFPVEASKVSYEDSGEHAERKWIRSARKKLGI